VKEAAERMKHIKQHHVLYFSSKSLHAIVFLKTMPY